MSMQPVLQIIPVELEQEYLMVYDGVAFQVELNSRKLTGWNFQSFLPITVLLLGIIQPTQRMVALSVCSN